MSHERKSCPAVDCSDTRPEEEVSLPHELSLSPVVHCAYSPDIRSVARWEHAGFGSTREDHVLLGIYSGEVVVHDGTTAEPIIGPAAIYLPGGTRKRLRFGSRCRWGGIRFDPAPRRYARLQDSHQPNRPPGHPLARIMVEPVEGIGPGLSLSDRLGVRMPEIVVGLARQELLHLLPRWTTSYFIGRRHWLQVNTELAAWILRWAEEVEPREPAGHWLVRVWDWMVSGFFDHVLSRDTFVSMSGLSDDRVVKDLRYLHLSARDVLRDVRLHRRHGPSTMTPTRIAVEHLRARLPSLSH